MTESSPLQETAVSSTDGDGKESSVACPACDRTFTSERGMKIHHKRIHGESIAGVEDTCEWCGDVYTTKRCMVSDSKYCGNECRLNALHEGMKREGNPNWIGRPTIKCESCGDEFEIKQYEKGDRRFCSDCWGQTGRQIDCRNCGDQFYVKLSRVKQAKYCSKECKGEWMSNNLVGEDHYSYKINTTHEFGPGWDRIAEECRKRDGHRCQSCGKEQSDHRRKLVAHHITPRKEFMSDGELNHERANRLSNLVTLCDSCHQRWEGIPLKPQLTD